MEFSQTPDPLHNESTIHLKYFDSEEDVYLPLNAENTDINGTRVRMWLNLPILQTFALTFRPGTFTFHGVPFEGITRSENIFYITSGEC